MLLMIDNFDSFTFNVVQYFKELGADVHVVRNNELSVDQLVHMAPSHLVISPGPCTPEVAGISIEAVRHFSGKIPVLGICLGHQTIGQVFGGMIVRAGKVMHGKNSWVHHEGKGVFEGLNKPLDVTRYHSLVIDKETLPDCLEVTAWTLNEAGEPDEIMGVRHKTYDVEGIQFHPEAILTEQGHELFSNFLQRGVKK